MTKLGTYLVFDDRAVEGEGVALLNAHALEVLAPSAVAFSQNALLLNLSPASLYLCRVGPRWGVVFLVAYRC